MRVHSNATTNRNQRLRIQSAGGRKRSCATLARQFAVSKTTVHRWKRRNSPEERSCRPQRIQYAFAPEEEQFILSLRANDLPLDEVVDAVQGVLPAACRSSVHRLFVRHGVNRRRKQEQQETGQAGTSATYGSFKEYGPGFLHIDCFYLPKLEGVKRYCFVAVDRATRLVYLAVYEHKDKQAATDFLARCLEFFPFRIEKILTDNGREFTLEGFRNHYGPAKQPHAFDQLCQEHGIEHRLTRPYTPKTNGMVERMNGLTKQNTTKQHTYRTAEEMLADLNAWLVRYNFCRKNRRIGGKTPYEAACLWFNKQPDSFKKKPEHLLTYRQQCSGT